MSIWALLPFKGAAGAKQRLAGTLSEAEREDLVLAMVRDVLQTLSKAPLLAGVVLASQDGNAVDLAEEFGCEVFRDTASDLSGAVAQASAYVAARGASGTLFVPGDVPLIQPADIVAVLEGHERVTLVPDARDIGTNAAASSPPNAFEYLFDGKSFKPHIASAARVGIEARVVRRPAFGLDVDTALELAAVARHGAGTRTGKFLYASGIAERLRRVPAPDGHYGWLEA